MSTQKDVACAHEGGGKKERGRWRGWGGERRGTRESLSRRKEREREREGKRKGPARKPRTVIIRLPTKILAA